MSKNEDEYIHNQYTLEAPDECPYCGSNQIMSDYFEDAWYFWCGQCLREVFEEMKTIYED